jgi:hypothetical protein
MPPGLRNQDVSRSQRLAARSKRRRQWSSPAQKLVESFAANEELRAANEELQSINEEYRSTSEELETSKEELSGERRWYQCESQWRRSQHSKVFET